MQSDSPKGSSQRNENFVESLSAQAPDRVDLERDLLPIHSQKSVGCHRPTQQKKGLQVDRRSSVFRAELLSPIEAAILMRLPSPAK